jgi:multidrug efflux pump subunit AcrA (membrane-fusion protein)
MSPIRINVLSIITRAVICAVLLIGSAAIAAMLVRTRPLPEPAAEAGERPRVLVMKAALVPVRREWTGFGVARAMDAADVPARLTSTAIEIGPEVRVGAPVRSGQVLVRLDDSEFSRQVEIAGQAIAELEAQLAQLAVEEASWTRRLELAVDDTFLARRDLERVEQAMAREAAQQRELDRARQALVAAEQVEVATREEVTKVPARRARLEALRLQQQAALRLAQLNVDRCTIVSPIDGVLQDVDLDEGETVQPGQRVARIVSLARIEVPLRLPASARPYVGLGDRVQLSSTNQSSAAEAAWSARIARIAPEDDADTRTVAVYLEYAQDPSTQPVLSPGRFTMGTVVSRELEQRCVVPRRALQGDRILIVRDDTICGLDIEVDYQINADLPATGLPDRQWAVLRRPLPEGTLVVVNAGSALSIGSHVTTLLPSEAGTATRPVEASLEASHPGATPAAETDTRPVRGATP